MSVRERIDPVRAWIGTVAAILLALVGGSVLFPRTVYVGFVWHYFWGPVYADAHGADCVAWAGGARELLSGSACREAAEPVAYIGYTWVSEVGYAITGLLALVGIVFLLRRLDLGDDPRFLFSLLPYMFLGGALRVVEDANDAVPADVPVAISYPWNALIISPVIYFTMFFFTLAALLASIWLARSGTVSRLEYPLAGIGTAGLLLTLGYLIALALATGYVGFHPQVAVTVLIVATLITAAVWYAIERFRPSLNRGTGPIGAVVIWGHSVDGVANVLITDWLSVIGAPGEYFPKHPLNEVLLAVVTVVVPPSVLEVIGDAWPFLVVKVIAAVLVIYLFDEGIFEESPRYAILLLVAIIAVGLGPGTRDMLRATFGI